MTSIPVFFSDAMVAKNPTSLSPSAGKPVQVVESWKKLGIDLTILPPNPATLEELCLAHDPDHVRDILACKKKNGFENTDPDVAAALPYTTGSMLTAARHLLAEKAPVAVAPCSGFHHAGYDEVEGFCTFNGLMVTALALHKEDPKLRIGILDFDMHYGNGTDNILDHLVGPRSFITHYTAGADYRYPQQAITFFQRLPKYLALFQQSDIILYQAGADPHVDDPFGGWLTTEQLRERDEKVFGHFKDKGVPVVWNLAGGYQREPDGSIPKVLEIHDNTMRMCAKVYG